MPAPRVTVAGRSRTNRPGRSRLGASPSQNQKSTSALYGRLSVLNRVSRLMRRIEPLIRGSARMPAETRARSSSPSATTKSFAGWSSSDWYVARCASKYSFVLWAARASRNSSPWRGKPANADVRETVMSYLREGSRREPPTCHRWRAWWQRRVAWSRLISRTCRRPQLRADVALGPERVPVDCIRARVDDRVVVDSVRERRDGPRNPARMERILEPGDEAPGGRQVAGVRQVEVRLGDPPAAGPGRHIELVGDRRQLPGQIGPGRERAGSGHRKVEPAAIRGHGERVAAVGPARDRCLGLRASRGRAGLTGHGGR